MVTLLDLAQQAAQLGLPHLSLTRLHPRPDALALVPEEVARRLSVLPLFCLQSQIFVATSQPHELEVLDTIRHLTGYTVRPVLATESELQAALTRCYLTPERTRLDSIKSKPIEIETGPQGLLMAQRDAPAIRLAELIVAQGVRLGASDIHIEPGLHTIKLRYRIDGRLQEYGGPPSEVYPAVVSRFKISANLDISEKRLPQDGRFSLEVDRRSYDLRLSCVPNAHGEGIVIRILNPHAGNQNLTDLGMPEETLDVFRRLAHRPHGMILVTGPTGSGKTTTLYATLGMLSSPDRKLVTLEDPVECYLNDVTQVQVRPEIGYSFAQGLKAMLRHDPDVILVGEIRDRESAEIAITASLTGHLLFSTLHTNDAALALTRLIDMGVPAYKVMSSLQGVLAQRLVRRLCSHCCEPAPVTRGLLEGLGLTNLPMGASPYRPVGCSRCHGLGYKGRLPLYELLVVNGAMRRLPERRVTSARLRKLAGRPTLRDAAVAAWATGQTSADEILSLAGAED